MLPSASNRWFAGVAAAAGAAATTMPLSYSWGLIPAVIATAMVVVLAPSNVVRWVCAVLGAVLNFLVLVGLADAPMAATFAAASALVMVPGCTSLGIAILLTQVSAIKSVIALGADHLFAFSLEASAPALAAIACLWLSRPSAYVSAITASFSTVILVWIGNKIPIGPGELIAISGLAPMLMACMLSLCPQTNLGKVDIAVASVLVLAMATWVWTPPRLHDEVYFALPNAPEAFTAKYFQHYAQALKFAGILAREAKSLSVIPKGALLLLPWMNEPLPRRDEWVGQIAELARAREWTVVIGGEHTNMGKIADRIARLVGRPILRDDLTVPPGNTDTSGPLHSIGLQAWRHNAILNRGASIAISSAIDRVLLAGDGWWSEPNIGEWMWVGDYLWHPGDRAGRLTIAAVIQDGGSRWVIIGDNSIMINRQLVADPRPFLQLLDAATLWGAFARDLSLLAAAGIMLVAIRFPFIVLLVVAIVLPLLGGLIGSKPSQAWADLYVGQTGFDDRNFNEALSQDPKLLLPNDWRIIRLGSIQGKVRLPKGNSVIFTLVDGSADLGAISLKNCKRLGSLPITDGPTLMDAQACRILGEAEVLLGTKRAAGAIRFRHKEGTTIVVLDASFLGLRAPAANRNWLSSIMGL